MRQIEIENSLKLRVSGLTFIPQISITLAMEKNPDKLVTYEITTADTLPSPTILQKIKF